ncbi:MAG: serine hydrolase [Kineosporiaceae bacterium]|nr:serine hydrolase [Kineosporiaceae bacterium]
MGRHRQEPEPVPRRLFVIGGLTLLTGAAIGGSIQVLNPDGDQAETTATGPTPSATTPSSTPSATEPSLSPSPAPSTVSSALRAGPDFARAAAAYDRTRPGRCGVAGVNLATGARIAYNEATTFTSASIVKVGILVALMLQLDGGMPSSAQRSRASRMIKVSDNDAADSLWSDIGRGTGYTRQMKRLGFTDTRAGSGGYWGATRTSPRDQNRLLTALQDDASPVTAEQRAYVLTLMREVDKAQRWGVSAATDSDEVWLKNGWLPAQSDNGLWAINSIGRVLLDTGDLALLTVLSGGSPSMGAGIATVERLASLAGAALSGRSLA